jgi:ferric-dicitrate binding protein FerR (iron transport regulator)
MITQEEINRLIHKYLEGSASEDELRNLLNWLKSETQNVNHFNQVCSIWESIPNSRYSETQTQYALEKLSSKIRDYENLKINKPRISHPSKYTVQLWKYAATILFIISLSTFVYIISNKQPQNKKVDYYTVIAPKNQKSRVILPDGTKVWLNCGSSLKFKTIYGNKIRDVYLNGEAYFEVAKNPDKPFLVYASSVTVKALGTSFNVKCYADDRTIETTLVEGKVEVRGKTSSTSNYNSVFLIPNEKAVFNRSDSKLSVSKMYVPSKENVKPSLQEQKNKPKTIASVIGWKDQQLVFEEEPFDELIKRLERWYNVTIEVKDSVALAKNSYTGKFVNNESIEQVLKILSRTTAIKYSIYHENITIQAIE